MDALRREAMVTMLSRLVSLLAAVLLLVGLVAGVVNQQVLDGSRFAGHVDSVRSDPAVARQIGLLLTDRVLDQQPDLTGLRPLLETASTALVASPALGPVVRTAVTPLHQALVSGDGDQVVFRLADVGALLVAAITRIAPDTRPVIPDDLDVTLASIGGQELSSDLVGTAHLVSLLSWLLPTIALVLLAAAGWWRRRSWRDAASRVGIGALAAAGAGLVLLVLAGFVVSRIGDETLGGALTVAVWGELSAPFWSTLSVVGAIGVLLRAAASPAVSLDPVTTIDRARRWLTSRSLSPVADVGRAVLLLGVGMLMLLRPLTVLSVAGSILGLLLMWSALHLLVRAVARWSTQRPGHVISRRRLESWRRASRPAGALVCGAGLVALVVLSATPRDVTLPTASADAGDACNGHVELCDRTYDEVAFAGTHNSMSAADQPGWFLAEQPHGILRQLDDGIRVLLIDSWEGQETQRDGLVANAEKSRATALAEAEQTYGKEVVQSALRLRDALDLTPTGPVEPYLCHALCELGSTKWEPLMVQIRTWLDQNPREVLTFFVQDEVSPADTAELVRRAGLMPYVHVPVPGEPWPTLGEMISSGRRVVFLMENSSGGTTDPWLIDSRIEVQDTPYSFTRASEFTCERFRGPADAPLFLVNHWLSNYASRVSDAQRVNAESVLLPRVEACQAERGRIPNFVAVDNYDRGDLFGVVDRLNGFG